MSHSDEYVNRLWLVLETVSATNPDMSLEDGLETARKVISAIAWSRANGEDVPDVGTVSPGPKLGDPAALGTWLGAHSAEVCNAILADKKIVAIKEARTRTGAALKEAKEAVDWLWARQELCTASGPTIPPF